MTKEERDKLRAYALAATQGDWVPYCDYQFDLNWLCNDKDHASIVVRPPGAKKREIDCYICDFHVDRTDAEASSYTIDPVDKASVKANIEYVIAAQPKTILALLDRIDELEAQARDAYYGARERDEKS